MSAIHKKQRQRRQKILWYLLDERQATLADMARATGISLPLVTSVVSQLQGEGWVRETPNVNIHQTGRPPVVFELNGPNGYVLGIDLGRVENHYLLLDLNFNCVSQRHEASPLLEDEGRFMDHLEEVVEEMLQEKKIPWSSLLGAGLSLPGIVHGRAGISETYFQFQNISLKDYLAQRFSMPFRIENDAKAMALGEMWYGAARNLDHVLCLNYGWGLGLGIIVNGSLYYGKDSLAGEFGHIQVDPQGDLCFCGKRGCLETFSSARSITQKAREKLSNGADSILKKSVETIDRLTPLDILEAANRGDQFAIEILDEAGRYLGQSIAVLINIFNPQKIIIGGDISRVADYILGSIRNEALKQSLVQLHQGTEFAISELGNQAAALGVARLAAQDILGGK